MDFDSFKTDLLVALKKNKKDFLRKFEANQQLIQANVGEEGDQKTIDRFVKDIINTLFIAKKCSIFEKFLKHPFFFKVYESFKNSEVLIEACKRNNKDVLKWLITMDINPCVQDENGMTALMHASKSSQQLFVVKYLVSKPECLNLVDKNGEIAAFHAIQIYDNLTEIAKSDIDINIRNNNNETVLLYCCRNEYFDAISALTLNKNIDVNVMDKAERTIAMILTEKGRYKELILLRKRGCDFNIINKNNESVLSILINKLYVDVSNKLAEYIRIVVVLVFSNCNFNIPVDEEGNTALMVFMIVQDWYTVYYVARNKKDIDLSIKNNFGESATSLFMKYGSYNKTVYDTFTQNPTFDFEFIDPNNNNNILMFSAMKEPKLLNTIVENNVNIINSINARNENALILATKFNHGDAVDDLLKFGIYVNQQDYLGNTALYYAVDTKNYQIIRSLLSSNADKDLKNFEGVSPLNHAHRLGDKKLIEALTNPAFIQQFGVTASNDAIPKPRYDPMEEYRETAEYLYPCISTRYPSFKMNYPLECLIKSIYMGNVMNVDMSSDVVPPYSSK